MHMHEFQAKELLASHEIEVPRGRVADNAADAERIARRFGADRFVVKAQVLSGDRETAGGVRFAATPEGVRQTADTLLGRMLVTPHTGPGGEKVRWVYVEEAVDAIKLFYAAVSLDRTCGALVTLASNVGGGDLEQRSKHDPGLIKRIPLRIADGEAAGDFDGLAALLGLSGAAAEGAARVFKRLGRIAVRLDATLDDAPDSEAAQDTVADLRTAVREADPDALVGGGAGGWTGLGADRRDQGQRFAWSRQVRP